MKDLDSKIKVTCHSLEARVPVQGSQKVGTVAFPIWAKWEVERSFFLHARFIRHKSLLKKYIHVAPAYPLSGGIIAFLSYLQTSSALQSINKSSNQKKEEDALAENKRTTDGRFSFSLEYTVKGNIEVHIVSLIFDSGGKADLRVLLLSHLDICLWGSVVSPRRLLIGGRTALTLLPLKSRTVLILILPYFLS